MNLPDLLAGVNWADPAERMVAADACEEAGRGDLADSLRSGLQWLIFGGKRWSWRTYRRTAKLETGQVDILIGTVEMVGVNSGETGELALIGAGQLIELAPAIVSYSTFQAKLERIWIDVSFRLAERFRGPYSSPSIR